MKGQTDRPTNKQTLQGIIRQIKNKNESIKIIKQTERQTDKKVN